MSWNCVQPRVLPEYQRELCEQMLPQDHAGDSQTGENAEVLALRDLCPVVPRFD